MGATYLVSGSHLLKLNNHFSLATIYVVFPSISSGLNGLSTGCAQAKTSAATFQQICSDIFFWFVFKFSH